MALVIIFINKGNIKIKAIIKWNYQNRRTIQVEVEAWVKKNVKSKLTKTGSIKTKKNKKIYLFI